MGSLGDQAVKEKPHAVCVPFPAQGHINPMLKVAKLLHFRGFHITFVNTEFNHNRLLRSRGPGSLDGLYDFRFETIPDGLPPSDLDVTQDIPTLCDSTMKTCLDPFRALLDHLNNNPAIPPVSCIVSDGVMSFTLDAAEELQIPEVLFWTTSACGFMGYLHYQELMDKGLTPFKDESHFTNAHLDTQIDWIRGMKNIRLRDLPTFIRTIDHNDIMLNFASREAQRVKKASALILNTFEDLEPQVLEAMRSILNRVYTMGPLQFLSNQIPDTRLASMGSNLWKEDTECIEWLDTKEPKSVVYVNYGSITVMTPDQLVEFAWGLANSKHPFLWIIRPDLVKGESAILPPEFLEETKDRGLLTTWCPQEQVLSHPSIGLFLTHCGWNSMLEAICGGVPVICWPFFAEQQTNCLFACTDWEIGMEIDSDVKRDEVDILVRASMKGEKGKQFRKKAMDWKEKAERAIAKCGSSYLNFDKLVEILLDK